MTKNKKKKKNRQTVDVMHQHKDELGRVFGAKHPVNLEHNNERTQRHHEYTLGIRSRMNKKI